MTVKAIAVIDRRPRIEVTLLQLFYNPGVVQVCGVVDNGKLFGRRL